MGTHRVKFRVWTGGKSRKGGQIQTHVVDGPDTVEDAKRFVAKNNDKRFGRDNWEWV